jgi:predicted tellurium resistance membrane protein TerC
MESFFSFEAAIAFLTLFGLELVLGIDNVIFISILSSRLPEQHRKQARNLGLSLAVITRILLLMSISWVISLTQPLFEVFSKSISGRDLILILGGLFLIAKSTFEIHHKLEEAGNPETKILSASSFTAVIFQILVLDLIFSLDSVITAVGMVNQISIMVAAVLASTFVMILTAKTISDFVEKHPTLKMLALSFLILVGFTLLTEGMGQHVSKGYIYFAMAFSLIVEILNIRLRSKTI